MGLYVAKGALVPPKSCLCGDKGQHELPERRGGGAVVRPLPGFILRVIRSPSRLDKHVDLTLCPYLDLDRYLI